MFAEHLLDALSRSACDPEIVQGIFSALAQKARQAVPGHQITLLDVLVASPTFEMISIPPTESFKQRPLSEVFLFGDACKTNWDSLRLNRSVSLRLSRRPIWLHCPDIWVTRRLNRRPIWVKLRLPVTHLGQATPALGQPAFHPGPLPDIQMAVQPGGGSALRLPLRSPRPLRDPATRPLRDQVMDTQDVIPDSFPLPDDAKEWAKELANQAYLRFLKEQPAKALQLETAGTEPEEWFAKELRAKVSGMSPSAVRPMWRTELGRIRRNVSGLEAKERVQRKPLKRLVWMQSERTSLRQPVHLLFRLYQPFGRDTAPNDEQIGRNNRGPSKTDTQTHIHISRVTVIFYSFIFFYSILFLLFFYSIFIFLNCTIDWSSCLFFGKRAVSGVIATTGMGL
ncbi:hypothetical protein PAPYR_9120 [Paratrimastix pyriformis]|uniref:Uncharacterized protein n=1 Tax=Paratrimastix pyriformis TaxID=342808 RepID=A0ABQ8UBN0_9EUKA|nr:hypothetical protein PAPYR_9120 [Paratrimastix pyriformis]